MSSDHSDISPSGLRYSEIDASIAEYVLSANKVLSAASDMRARWSSYSPSHNTFEMLVGEPEDAKNNIVLSMPACRFLSGPPQWHPQQIQIVSRCDRSKPVRSWEFEFVDSTVGFRALGEMFRWRRGYDLAAQGGLWIGRGDGPVPSLSSQEADEKARRGISHFYEGLIGYAELRAIFDQVLYNVPVVKARELDSESL